MRADQLAKQIGGETPPLVIDVRSRLEYRAGHIPGALHLPVLKILFRLARYPDDKNRTVVITCEHGPRAQLAKPLVVKAGYKKVELLEGHMAGWRTAKLPLEK